MSQHSDKPTTTWADIHRDREGMPPYAPAPIVTRRRVGIVAVGLAACFLALVAGVRLTHPRDEADFLLAADQIRSADVTVPGEDDALLREGDFACRWLDLQDRAFWNHGPWYNRDSVLDRYVGETRPVDVGAWGPPAQASVSRARIADAAWSQLCGGTWYWHRPHGPSLGTGGGGAEGD